MEKSKDCDVLFKFSIKFCGIACTTQTHRQQCSSPLYFYNNIFVVFHFLAAINVQFLIQNTLEIHNFFFFIVYLHHIMWHIQRKHWIYLSSQHINGTFMEEKPYLKLNESWEKAFEKFIQGAYHNNKFLIRSFIIPIGFLFLSFYFCIYFLFLLVKMCKSILSKNKASATSLRCVYKKKRCATGKRHLCFGHVWYMRSFEFILGS